MKMGLRQRTSDAHKWCHYVVTPQRCSVVIGVSPIARVTVSTVRWQGAHRYLGYSS